MKRVAITGAGGFIGRAAVRALAEAGHSVVAIVRNAPAASLFPSTVDTVVLSDLREQPDALAAAISGVRTVFHLADNPQRTRGVEHGSLLLAQAVSQAMATAGARRLVFFSSIYATLDACGQHSLYGAGKRAAEKMFFSRADLITVALRLPPVYGPGAKSGIAMLAKLVRSGLPLPFGCAKAPRDYLALSNLTALLVALAQADDTLFTSVAGRSWEPSDGAPIGTAELTDLVGRAMSRETRLLAVPREWLALPASLLGASAQVNAIFERLETADDSVLQAKTNWNPCADWHLNLAYLRS